MFLDYHLRSKLTAESISGVIIFGSIRFLLKKIIKPKLFKKKPKPVQTNSFGSVRFFKTKTGQTGLARFFFQFSSVFSRFFPVLVRFFAYKTKTEPNRPVFSKF